MLPYYYSLNEYITKTFGHKIYKLALSGGMTCPNRDGTIDNKGCIFCSSGGSGDFTGAALLQKSKQPSSEEEISGNLYNPSAHHVTICTEKWTNQQIQIYSHLDQQIEIAKAQISSKYQGDQFIAYFQSYTNTYADISYLRALYYKVIERPDVCILSIATRPDCLNSEVLRLLKELNQIKPVWIELGLQTIHEFSANYIRRGYPLSVYDQAVSDLKSIGISPIVHMILGLPGETTDMMVDTARYIGASGASGIKLQLLHVIKHTDLAKDYEAGKFKTMELDKYIACLGRILEVLPNDLVIHRLTGDGPKNLLIAPLWSGDKKRVMNTMNHYFKDNNIFQGRIYNEYGSNNTI